MSLNISNFRPLPKSLSQGEGLTVQNIIAIAIYDAVADSPFSLGERGWGIEVLTRQDT